MKWILDLGKRPVERTLVSLPTGTLFMRGDKEGCLYMKLDTTSITERVGCSAEVIRLALKASVSCPVAKFYSSGATAIEWMYDAMPVLPCPAGTTLTITQE